jgi:hypothetical protein
MGWVVSLTPRPRFTPVERAPCTHWIGGWVNLRAGLDTEVLQMVSSVQNIRLKFCVCSFFPWQVHGTVSHYYTKQYADMCVWELLCEITMNLKAVSENERNSLYFEVSSVHLYYSLSRQMNASQRRCSERSWEDRPCIRGLSMFLHYYSLLHFTTLRRRACKRDAGFGQSRKAIPTQSFFRARH